MRKERAAKDTPLMEARDAGVTKIPEPIKESYFIGLGINGNHNYSIGYGAVISNWKSGYFKMTTLKCPRKKY